MAETRPGKIKRRKPLDAMLLSLLYVGLGQVYCGQIVKGLVFMVLSAVCGGIALVGLAQGGWRMGSAVVVGSLGAGVVVTIIAVVDAWYAAKHTAKDYVLKEYNRWYVYLIFIVLSMGGQLEAAVHVKSNLAEAFRIASHSMYPAIDYNDRVLGDKIVYQVKEPAVGDIVVFKNPDNRRQSYIKRIIAVAGDTVAMKDGELYISGKRLERDFVRESTIDMPKGKVRGKIYLEKNRDTEYETFVGEGDDVKQRVDFEETEVPAYCCFVLGDNRNMSLDSRDFGAIPVATIKARAGQIYWPWAHRARLGQ